MTQQKTRKQIHTEELTQFAQTLKDNGFTVIVSAKHPFEWLYFYKNGKFGNVGKEYFGRYHFGTVHKPCCECGTGFSTASETDLTINNAEDSLIFAPNWASQTDRNAVRKYTSLDDFINYNGNKWAEYYIL